MECQDTHIHGTEIDWRGIPKTWMTIFALSLSNGHSLRYHTQLYITLWRTNTTFYLQLDKMRKTLRVYLYCNASPSPSSLSLSFLLCLDLLNNFVVICISYIVQAIASQPVWAFVFAVAVIARCRYAVVVVVVFVALDAQTSSQPLNSLGAN